MGVMINDADLQKIKISRIGKPREGMNRVLKLTFLNMVDRDEFVKDSNKLKTAPEMWKKVYVKKDQHPVYLAENNRLRKKMETMRKDPNNAGKNVVIKDGKLTIDGNEVDHNLFFH